LTLPAPDGGQRKVQPGKGVKIHNIYYWADIFRNPEIEKSMVWVRYDPWDAGVAYALAGKQWVKCISSYYQYFQGRSEKEIRLISAELNQHKRNYERNRTLTDKELVNFLNSQQASEGLFLKQRLRDAEHYKIHKIIQNNSEESHKLHPNYSQSNLQIESQQSHETETNYNFNSDTETFEYYGEF